MRDNISFRLLSFDDLLDFKSFMSKYWSKEHIFVVENSVFEWQHRGVDNYHHMSAWKNNKLIGVHGFIPQSHFDEQLPNNQIFLTLWRAIDEGNIGVGFKLFLKTTKQCSYSFIGSVGINKKLVPFHKWQGFCVNKMNHHVLLSPDVTSFRVAKVSNKFRFDYKANQENLAMRLHELEKDDFIVQDIEKLFLYQVPSKSKGFIINRYYNHPIYKYKIYGFINKNILEAVLVLRPIEILGTVVLRLVDYYGANETISLLQYDLLKLIKLYNAEYLDIYSYGFPASLLEGIGFVNRYTQKSMIVPNYFEPYEQKNVDIYCGYINHLENKNVRMFKSDGDQDRPNKISY